MALVECENLGKVFGGGRGVRALDGLTLSVEEGEVFGLLGPNGSGKTTFVKCCLNIIFPTSGSLKVLGRRPGHPASARQTGYLPENANLYDHLTGRTFLQYHAELAGVPLNRRRQRIDEVLDDVRLDPAASLRRLRTYSKGMLQRIGLAQALIGVPRLIFLDEPQTGLDPIGRRHVKDIMKNAARRGATVLFSSHVLGDVEDVADRVAIIDKGKLRKIAPLNALTLHTNKVFIRLRHRVDSTIPTVPEPENSVVFGKLAIAVSEAGGTGFDFSNGVLTCTLKDEEQIPHLVHKLVNLGMEIFEVTQERMSLEEVFLKEFGEKISAAAQSSSPETKAS